MPKTKDEEVIRLADEMFSVWVKTKTETVYDNKIRWNELAKYMIKNYRRIESK